MRRVTVSIFKFDELSDEAKTTAIELNRYMNVQDDWYTPIYEGKQENLEALGFGNIEFSFSGFANQGDGASFTSETFDFLKFNETHKVLTDARILKLIEKGSISVYGNVNRNGGMYVHERTTTFNLEFDFYGDRIDYDNIEAVLNGLEEKIQSIIVDLNIEVYKALEKYHDELISDEFVIQDIKANEYEFNENGTNY